MSRVGRKPVTIPEKVEFKYEARKVSVKGPKGELHFDIHPRIELELGDKEITIKRSTDITSDRALHGMVRSVLANMMVGVTEGYKKELEIIGVGVRAEVKGKQLVMQLGFTHPINYNISPEVQVVCPNPTRVVITGSDKQRVGQVASEIRAFNPPEPYKGKGIRYLDEHVRRKQGKKVGG